MDTLEQAKKILREYDGRKCRIMEVCGTHTHEIFRLGIRQLLSEKIQLISGPGCPVCVTPVSFIDEAIWLAEEKQCMICTFGDLVRVPGSRSSLQLSRGRGSDIRVVYSPLDAVALAAAYPEKQVVFLSVGFETTTPASCLAVQQAQQQGLHNFSLLTANKTMPGAIEAMAGATDLFLYPGHVLAITGTAYYEALARRGISGVCAGFTGRELLTALAIAVTEFAKLPAAEDNVSGAEKPGFFRNCYPRVVTAGGSPNAQKLVAEMLTPVDAEWRGIGVIPGSGLALQDILSDFDARRKYGIPRLESHYKTACRCGEVLTGKIRSEECPLFGKACTPEHPVGACMVSSEGACAAWYSYGMIGGL